MSEKRNASKHTRMNCQSGVALIIALLTLFVLTALAGAIIFATQTQSWSTSNYKSMLQARYAAEAGANHTLNYLLYTYTPPTNMAAYDLTKYPVQDSATHSPIILSAMTGVTANYPDATVQSAFSSALKDASVPGVGLPTSYEVTAKLLSMQAGAAGGAVQTWEITSQGNVASVRNAQVQLVMKIQRIGTPMFGYGLFATGTGCDAIDFSKTDYTDSFDSSSGTYATTVLASGGNIGTNGNMTMSGSAQVNGTLSTPKSGTGACGGGTTTALTNSGSGNVSGGLVALSSPVTYPNPPAPSPAPPTTTMSLSLACGTVPTCTNLALGSVALAPGQYGNVVTSGPGGGTALHLRAGTYNMNSLVLTGGGPIVIDSGPVILNIAGASAADPLDFSKSSVVNSVGVPSNFQIYYAGSATVTLSGGSSAFGVVYAPNAPINLSGGSAWFGSVIGSTVTDTGGSPLHYDRSLANTLLRAGAYYPISFSWSKF